MTIYFLRHASAGKNKLPGKQDEKRTLDQKGEKQSREMGRFLKENGVKAEAIISSPLTRAIQTAHLAAEQMGFEEDITLDNALRPEASFQEFEETLEHYGKAKSVIVVGHNPNLSAFLSLLITANAREDVVELKKGAVAEVEAEKGKGVLNWCVTPKLLRSAQDSARTSSRPKTSRK
jgi:phosphohistidine phosphatase